MFSSIMDDDDWNELSLSHRCYLCRVLVPHGTMDVHKRSQLHMTARDIASEALRRIRKEIDPISKKNTEESDGEDDVESADPTTDTLVSFCGPCALVVPLVDFAAHNRSGDHVFAEKCELVFDERVREYIDEDLLEFLVSAPSSGGTVEKFRTVKRYECHVCNLEIPEIYKEDHEKSTRHRGCVALANEVTKRASLEFCTYASKGVKKTFDSGCLEIRGRKMSDLRAAYYGIRYFRNPFYFQPTTKTE